MGRDRDAMMKSREVTSKKKPGKVFEQQGKQTRGDKLPLEKKVGPPPKRKMPKY